jgi:hypothetical protein
MDSIDQLPSGGFYIVFILQRIAKSRTQITVDVAIRGRIRRVAIGYSARNYQIVDADSGRQDNNA